MHAFPRGACSDASLLLGAWLADNGRSGFDYVCGLRIDNEGNCISHGWRARGDLVVDITADQFTDGPGSVVVASPSPWHEREFEVETRHSETDFRIWRGADDRHLFEVYDELRRIMDS
jgi:hypothetical protein